MGIREQEPLLVKTSKPAIRQRISKQESRFIQNLIYVRKKKGLTQVDLAKMTRLDQASIGRLETMRVNPTLKTVINILDAMDMQLIIVDKD
ncbi:helix-turn-helix domain-containing protein [Domibacillus epiphyticus]|uniref:HTH cro/C1-type domain-containing protein n=1 Tax=Domibacillus epiphyticus TaxID=1714355 RepID=A0A1V2A3R6_9BACI|nr:helix-turn-helix transcriptional regulator [Domibacillus epiphyticus]OMP65641.1 hypothetical protein BTO28_16290 [Domibacillus epiphyticus]